MSVKGIAEGLARLLGVGPVGISVTSETLETLERLGAGWLAAAVRPASLLQPECSFAVELHVDDHQPMQNCAEVGWNSRVGVITVGRGPLAKRVYHVTLPGDDVLNETAGFSFIRRGSRRGEVLSRVYTTLYKKSPLLLDSYRQWRNTGKSAPLVGVPTAQATTYPPVAHSADRVMWIAMHWAESGGAESWAWEQARIAKAAGFKLVVTFDRTAPQRLLDRAFDLTDAVYLCGNVLTPDDWPAFVDTLVTKHSVTDVHIHHSLMAYTTLPALRLIRPGVHVEDSTHIAEYRGGGFVHSSLEQSDLIDLHHVISPELYEVYLRAGVSPERIALHPLTGFTTGSIQVAAGHPRDSGPLRVGFLGRLSPQKRPYLFQRVAAVLSVTDRSGFAFVMQGSGELQSLVDRDEKCLNLSDFVTRRDWGPVSEFLEQVDVLLVSSDNEGLTLTTLEADAAGVLVLSSDVGSQRSVVADGALLPRPPLPFVIQACSLLRRLRASRSLFVELLKEQADKVAALREIEPASVFYTRHYQEELVK